MLKLPSALIVCIAWLCYATGKDTKPVGKPVHIMTHGSFLAFLAMTLAFVP